jgi:hypothetical protein
MVIMGVHHRDNTHGAHDKDLERQQDDRSAERQTATAREEHQDHRIDGLAGQVDTMHHERARHAFMLGSASSAMSMHHDARYQQRATSDSLLEQAQEAYQSGDMVRGRALSEAAVQVANAQTGTTPPKDTQQSMYLSCTVRYQALPASVEPLSLPPSISRPSQSGRFAASSASQSRDNHAKEQLLGGSTTTSYHTLSRGHHE